MKLILLLCSLTFGFKSLSQKDSLLINYDSISIPYHLDTSEFCGNSYYWDVVKQGQSIIPELIEMIRDTNKTTILISCEEMFLTKGDVAFLILDEMLRLPLYQITRIQWCVANYKCDFAQPSGWFVYLHLDRETFYNNLFSWYEESKVKMKTVPINVKNKTTCQLEFGVQNKIIINNKKRVKR